MKKILFLLLSLMSIPAHAEESLSVYSKLSIWGNSTPMALNSFEHWDNTFQSGTHAAAYTWVETGFQAGPIGAAKLWRENAYMKFSKDAARFYYLSENHLPLFTPMPYHIYIRLKQFRVTGERLFIDLIDKPNFRWRVGYSQLDALWLYDGNLQGNISAISETDYNFDNLNVDYYYSKDLIFKNRVVQRPLGNGRSFDTEFEWSPTNNLRMHFVANDIAAYIRWHDAPFTNAQLSSDNKSYDEDGYVTVHPLLHGKNETKTFRQSLPVFAVLQGHIKIRPQLWVNTTLTHTWVKNYLSIGVSRQTYIADVGASYNLQTQAIELKLSNRYLYFSVLSNDLNIDKARHLALQAGVTLYL